MPLHVRAGAQQVAATAVLVGDPGRAVRGAAMLEGAECYNEHRGLLGYTGRYGGQRVSIQATGMGGPSAAIVTEELAGLGVRTVIRAGTCGAVGQQVGVLDLAIATGAVPMEGTTRQYVRGDPYAPVADFGVTRALLAAASVLDRPSHVGLFVSEDAFYHQADDWEVWRQRGVIAVEMEASAIFTVALHRALAAGCVCLAVDVPGKAESWADDAAIAAGEVEMLRVAFDAAVALAG